MDRIQEFRPDPTQEAAIQAALALRGVSIIGAPGSGKTSVLLEVLREVSVRPGGDGRAPRIALLTQDRRAAADLRDRVTRALGARGESLVVQTLSSFAYGIVQRFAAAVNRPAPELLSGPDEDALLREILNDPSAHIEFPEFADSEEIRGLSGFRAQLRNLITRAGELGLTAEQLEALGRAHPELGVTAQLWIAGGQLMNAYKSVVILQDAARGADRLDHSQLITTATALLRDWEVRTSEGSESAPVPVPRWDWILVDDAQNAPRSIVELLRVLSSDGARIIAAGNPDQAVQGFRGGVASLPGDLTLPAPEGLGLESVYLGVRHRGGAALAAHLANLEAKLPVRGAVAKHRRARPLSPEDAKEEPVRAEFYVNGEEELEGIAQSLLEARRRGTPYSRMAVISRSAAAHRQIRDVLVRRGIPVAAIASQEPLRAHPMVAAILEVIDIALSDDVASERVVASLQSPLVGMDAMEVKRIARQLRALALEEAAQRDPEGSDLGTLLPDPAQLLAGAVLDAEHVPSLPRLRRVGALIRRIREAARTSGGQAEQVLWAAWDGAGLAPALQRRALGVGPEADAAGQALDAVLRLFRVAQRDADRDPDVSIVDFRQRILEQDLPEDTVARQGGGAEEVQLATPSSAQGAEWDVVVVQGLQDGAWPNPRVRDPLAGTGKLTALITGQSQGSDLVSAASARVERSEVIADELRQLLHAASRSSGELVLTAVNGEGGVPSRFFSLFGVDTDRTEVPTVRADAPAVAIRNRPPILPDLATPTALIAQIRRAGRMHPDDRKELAAALATLRRAGVREADRLLWLDELPPSTTAPHREAGELRFSPSAVDEMVTNPVPQFMDSIGASDQNPSAAIDRGNAIHHLAEWFGRRDLEGHRPTTEEYLARARQLFPVPDRADQQHEYAQSWELIRRLYPILASPEDSVIAVEEPLEAVLQGDEPVRGGARADRLVRRGDGVHILDFKTGEVETNVQNNAQLLFYQLLYEAQTGEEPAGGELVALKRQSKRSGLEIPLAPENEPEFEAPFQRQQEAPAAAARERAAELLSIVTRLLRAGELPVPPVTEASPQHSRALDLHRPEERIFS